MNVVSDKGRCYGAFIFLMLLLTSCNMQSTPIHMTVTAPSTVLPIEVIASPTLGTTIAVPTDPSEVRTLQDIILAQCLEVRSELPMEHRIPWDLFVVHGSVPYVLNPNDGTTTDLPFFVEKTPEGFNKFSGEYHISPDGKWLAYQDTDSSKLFVESMETLLTSPGQDRIVWAQNERFLLRRWVSNDTVLLNYWKPENIGFITTLFLDPFTGEKHEFSLEQMPNYLNYKLGGAVMATHYFGEGELVPDPTMKRVVYPEKMGDEIYNTLWDRETGKSIARLRYFIAIYNAPLWSLDGDNFLIMGLTEKSAEWFQVTREGVIRQATDFGDFQPDVFFAKPSRSWDGRYLAFQVIYNQQKNVKYLVLDLTSPMLQGFCVDSIPLLNSNEQPPVWSPDSRYLVISNVDANSYGDLILVDVEARQAYQIGQDVHARGWIVKP